MKMTRTMPTMATTTGPRLRGPAAKNRGNRFIDMRVFWLSGDHRFDIELCANDALYSDGLAAADWRAGLRSSWRGVSNATLDISNFADPILRNPTNSGRRCSRQRSDARFTRALRFFEN